MPWKDPEKRREYDRRRAGRIHDPLYRAKRRAWQRKHYAENAEYRERVKAASRAQGREQWRAYAAVRRALERGELQRPDACTQCGAAGFVEASHTDYAKPLEVRWLCRPCHRQDDSANPKRK